MSSRATRGRRRKPQKQKLIVGGGGTERSPNRHGFVPRELSMCIDVTHVYMFEAPSLFLTPFTTHTGRRDEFRPSRRHRLRHEDGPKKKSAARCRSGECSLKGRPPRAVKIGRGRGKEERTGRRRRRELSSWRRGDLHFVKNVGKDNLLSGTRRGRSNLKRRTEQKFKTLGSGKLTKTRGATN